MSDPRFPRCRGCYARSLRVSGDKASPCKSPEVQPPRGLRPRVSLGPRSLTVQTPPWLPWHRCRAGSWGPPPSGGQSRRPTQRASSSAAVPPDRRRPSGHERSPRPASPGASHSAKPAPASSMPEQGDCDAVWPPDGGRRARRTAGDAAPTDTHPEAGGRAARPTLMPADLLSLGTPHQGQRTPRAVRQTGKLCPQRL